MANTKTAAQKWGKGNDSSGLGRSGLSGPSRQALPDKAAAETVAKIRQIADGGDPANVNSRSGANAGFRSQNQ